MSVGTKPGFSSGTAVFSAPKPSLWPHILMFVKQPFADALFLSIILQREAILSCCVYKSLGASFLCTAAPPPPRFILADFRASSHVEKLQYLSTFCLLSTLINTLVGSSLPPFHRVARSHGSRVIPGCVLCHIPVMLGNKVSLREQRDMRLKYVLVLKSNAGT